MVPATSMVIQNGEIVAVNDDEFGCSMCDEIDLGGGYVIPGLIDLHQHLGTGGFGALDTNARVSLFRKNLYWGITTVFNPLSLTRSEEPCRLQFEMRQRASRGLSLRVGTSGQRAAGVI